MTDKSIERFWLKVNKTEGCWLWQGKPNHKGYGRYCVNRRIILAHRFAWEITNGPISDGLYICHTCDVPACVNPSHMFLGTKADNNADMRNKGRGVNPPAKVNKTSFQKGVTSGENHPRAKMTEKDVREAIDLRKRGWSFKDLASKYGVKKSSIYNAVKGSTWQLVEGDKYHPEKRLGDNHPNSKLTEQKVREARLLHGQGWTGRDLAKKFGVNEVTMSYALNGKTWRHLV
jgi:lambda repressor-like predicted transcriptional regulator